MKNESCKTCIYWFSTSATDEAGICRYNPPVSHMFVIPAGRAVMGMEQSPQIGVQAVQPQAQSGGWCGKHAANPAILS